MKSPGRVLSAFAKLLSSRSSWVLAGWILRNLALDLHHLPDKWLPLALLPRYGSVPPRLRRYVGAAQRGLRRQRWSYLGMNLYWQLELTRAQILLQRLGKRIEHLTAILALCQHVEPERVLGKSRRSG